MPGDSYAKAERAIRAVLIALIGGPFGQPVARPGPQDSRNRP